MKGYSIDRLKFNPLSNGFFQIIACTPIKSASHFKLPIVFLSQPVCINDLPITGDLSVLSPLDKSLQRPGEQDWQRAEHLHTNMHTHKSVALAVRINRVVR